MGGSGGGGKFDPDAVDAWAVSGNGGVCSALPSLVCSLVLLECWSVSFSSLKIGSRL